MRMIASVLACTAWVAGGAAADEASDRAFAQATGTKPAFSLRSGSRIVGITHEATDTGDVYRVIALREDSGGWKRDGEGVLDPDDEAHRALLDPFSVVEIGQAPYVFFSLDVTREGTANAGSGEVAFHLVDVGGLETHSIVFWGAERGNGKVEGQLGPPSREVAGRADLLAFLKSKVAASPRIHHGERDSMSWVEDWKAANRSLPDPARVPAFRPVPIRWEYYDRDPMGEHAASADASAEDAAFKVTAYFRSSLIGYDKARRRYFPIWVDSCAHGCHKEIRSLRGGVLSFVFAEWDDDPPKVLSVDLRAGTVRMDVE